MHYGDNPRIQTVDNKPCFACGPDHSFFLEHSQLVWFFSLFCNIQIGVSFFDSPVQRT